MVQFHTILCCSILLYFTSCNNNKRHTYAIRDFDKALQPYLIKIVSHGIVGNDSATNYITKHITDIDLKHLSNSEHPVLRAVAFRAIMDRQTFDHFAVIMNNLDDTAIVATDVGEWGVKYLRVADDMLQHGKWKDTLARQQTIEKIIASHNYLKSAYDRLLYVEPDPVYYPCIKEMVLRERTPFDDFEQTEDALYALARYRKETDIPLIKQMIQSNIHQIGIGSFALMSTYPNEAYLDIYESFFPRDFYRKICVYKDTELAKPFFNSIAVHKNKRSANILSSILKRTPFMPCPTDTGHLKKELVYSIKNNSCEAYRNMMSQVETLIKEYEAMSKKNQYDVIPIDLPVFPTDTTQLRNNSKEPVTW